VKTASLQASTSDSVAGLCQLYV